MTNYKEKIAMRFNISQLDNVIVALINNPFNKKFASNISTLFALFQTQTYTDDFMKEVRVYMIKTISRIITETNGINDKDQLLNVLDFDGKYYNDATEIMNELVNIQLSESELQNLDTMVSNQLKYKALDENADKMIDLMQTFKTENYDNVGEIIREIEESVTCMSKDLKSARQSLDDSDKDLDLSSNNFIAFLDEMIQEARNPASRVKTGIQYLNAMLGGGFEKGQDY